MYVIGITGASGSGKTTLSNKLLNHFGGKASLISLDSYYRDFPELSFEKRSALNFDSPDIFEYDLLLSDICTLKQSNSIPCRQYNFTTHRRDPDKGEFEPTDILILEGIHIFAKEEIRDMCDLKIFVELDSDIAILRRLKRDVEERGRDIDSVTGQYLKTVKPMYEKYIRNYKQWVDIVVPTLSSSSMAAEMIADYVLKVASGK